MTTELHQKVLDTDAAWKADEMNLDKLHASDKAFADYMAAMAAARKVWMALPAGDAKDSAETNADDTEGCAEDELFWLEIAIRTFEMNG